MIKYFEERWNIKFRPFIEKSKLYSLATKTNEDSDSFIEIIRPYVKQVPSLLYKIRDSFTKKEFIAQQNAVPKRETLSNE